MRGWHACTAVRKHAACQRWGDQRPSLLGCGPWNAAPPSMKACACARTPLAGVLWPLVVRHRGPPVALVPDLKVLAWGGVEKRAVGLGWWLEVEHQVRGRRGECVWLWSGPPRPRRGSQSAGLGGGGVDRGCARTRTCDSQVASSKAAWATKLLRTRRPSRHRGGAGAGQSTTSDRRRQHRPSGEPSTL